MKSGGRCDEAVGSSSHAGCNANEAITSQWLGAYAQLPPINYSGRFTTARNWTAVLASQSIFLVAM